MKFFKILCFVLLIFLGIAVFIFGGYDDSPGAQLLGAVIAATGIFFTFRALKR